MVEFSFFNSINSLSFSFFSSVPISEDINNSILVINKTTSLQQLNNMQERERQRQTGSESERDRHGWMDGWMGGWMDIYINIGR